LLISTHNTIKKVLAIICECSNIGSMKIRTDKVMNAIEENNARAEGVVKFITDLRIKRAKKNSTISVFSLDSKRSLC
jgi:hypothetical protein